MEGTLSRLDRIWSIFFHLEQRMLQSLEDKILERGPKLDSRDTLTFRQCATIKPGSTLRKEPSAKLEHQLEPRGCRQA